MFGTKKGLLLILLILAFGSGALTWADVRSWVVRDEPQAVQISDNMISPRARVHILQGDHRGGGHMFGTGKPCKSEFPQNWNEEKIISVVTSLAANDNLDWRQQSNGYFTAQKMVEGVKVRVVLDREKDDVVTAYPVNIPRNPCPVPANDNRKPD